MFALVSLFINFGRSTFPEHKCEIEGLDAAKTGQSEREHFTNLPLGDCISNNSARYM